MPDQWHPWIAERLAGGQAPGEVVAQLERLGIPSRVASDAVRSALTGRPSPRHRGAVASVAHARNPAIDCWPAAYPFRQCSESVFEGHRVRQVMRLAQPAVALLENVLSAAECEALIEAARPQLERALVIDPRTGAQRPDPARSSDRAAIGTGTFPALVNIQARLAWLMGCDPRHAETLQVLRYGVGGEYQPHTDDFANPDAEGGQRLGTLVIYLRDVALGGTTAFPELGLQVAPSRGMGVYFAYGDAHGRIDSRLLHAGMPLLSGEKWVATQWVRDRPLPQDID
ncbi:MAG TPA: 2OG-Fe(II) oxygenase [Stenotrophomonas sp.]|nr:2OG-Fe(II) oxygenase [Stenotrophomonas sp.]